MELTVYTMMCNLQKGHRIIDLVMFGSFQIGIKCFNVIKEYLKAMMLSKNRSEWDLAYQYEILKINHYPKKLDLLKGIYDSPEYHAGYYTRYDW